MIFADPKNITETEILEAFDTAKQTNWTKKELDTYDYISMKKGDRIAQIITAENKGIKKGIQEEKKNSKQKIQEEKKNSEKKIQEEKRKTDAERKKADAERMKADIYKIKMILELNKNNVPINVIAISSKLSENEVNEILNNNNGGK